MIARSIRARLTSWYVAVLVVSTTGLAVGAVWLVERSLSTEADANLTARLDGVRQFIVQTSAGVPPEDLPDEFHEFAELTMGAVLLEVTDDAGTILNRPATPDWGSIAGDRSRPVTLGDPDVTSVVVGGAPYRVARARTMAAGRRYRLLAALPMSGARDAVARLARGLAWLLPIVWVVAGFGGYAISRRALAPVDRMARAAGAITVRELHHRLEVPAADDELRRLAVTFNDMLGRLEAAVADLSQLTAEASHELRTPVALVRATAEVALSRPRSADEYRHALDDILEHAVRMSALVGDLLRLARLDAGMEASEAAPVDLTRLVGRAVEDIAARAIQSALTVEAALPDAPIVVAGEADSLMRLAAILLDNAVKYTDPGGRVRVVVARDEGPSAAPDEVVIEVIDSGIGIDPAERPHVFDRFYRGAAARARGDGAGLGLAMARTIVLRHGGSIAILEPAGGLGGHVCVRLPVASGSR